MHLVIILHWQHFFIVVGKITNVDLNRHKMRCKIANIYKPSSLYRIPKFKQSVQLFLHCFPFLKFKSKQHYWTFCLFVLYFQVYLNRNTVKTHKGLDYIGQILSIYLTIAAYLYGKGDLFLRYGWSAYLQMSSCLKMGCNVTSVVYKSNTSLAPFKKLLALFFCNRKNVFPTKLILFNQRTYKTLLLSCI